jgi:3-oxoacyl-[acyl-carrier protein] reductase
MPSWVGKVVLVTGAGQACGRAIAEDFGGRGASVVVNDINADGGQETVRRIEATGGTATFIQADVSVESERCVPTGVSTSPSTTPALSCR